MYEETQDDTEAFKAAGILLALRGWSRGCAALARREFARSLGRRRLSGADLAAFSRACAEARTAAGIAVAVSALLIAARPAPAKGDLLRGSSYANPGSGGAAASAAQQQAAQRQVAQAQRARDALARTTQAVNALRAAQLAARSAAQAAAASVANGLGAGGLRVAAGVGTDPSLWQNANLPVQTAVSGDRTQVTVVQNAAKAILTWDEFHVGKNTEIYFDQTAGGANASQWIALNRVTSVTSDPSQILGSIRAEGQVYLVNPNGVIFGGASQVNVHTLVASGLDFKGATVAERDAAFRQGIAFDDNRANYTLGVDAGSGRPVGDVTVRSGARIVTDESGAIYLFGKNVTNAGTLTAPGGQVGIAAGERVWVSKNRLGYDPSSSEPQVYTDATLRGLRFAVDDGGAASNTGVIETPRGNITVTGKDVTNEGALVATTSPVASGSVTLLAGDGAAPDALYWMWATDFGVLNLAPTSVISIAPDNDTDTGFASQFIASRIDMQGRTVTFGSGSTVYAPAATMAVSARTHDANADRATDTSAIDVRPDALIHLAGLTDVSIAMETNSVSAELRLDELKDAPLQRDGALRGEKILVDLRRGTTFADVAGYYDLIALTAAQSMTGGGTLKLDGGTVVTRAGSVVNLSGGYLRYADGYVSTTRLLRADGRVSDIATASPDIVYTGVYDTYRRFEKGYIQGGDAGSLVIGPQNIFVSATNIATNVVENLAILGSGSRPYQVDFGGEMTASAVAGVYQREILTGTLSAQQLWKAVPKSGSITTGYSSNDDLTRHYGANVIIGGASDLAATYVAGTAPGAGENTIRLPASFFDGNSFGHLTIASGIGGGDLVVTAGTTVNLGVAGTLSFTGANAGVYGSIVAPGGSVSIVADYAKGYFATNTAGVSWNTAKPSITLGSDASIDVSGVWINEVSGAAYAAGMPNGGSIALETSGNLRLAAGSSLHADGGGRHPGVGSPVYGDAGSITLLNDLRSSDGFVDLPSRPDGVFDISAVRLSAYALGDGGRLVIGTSRAIVIGSGAVDTGVTAADTLNLSAAFFERDGFSDFSLHSVPSLDVADGARIAPRALSYLPGAELWALPTGGSLASVAQRGVLADEIRNPGSLTLSAGDESFAATVRIGVGAEILMDPLSSVTLSARGGITVAGTLRADGGNISLVAKNVSGANVVRLESGARLLAAGFRDAAPDGRFTVRSVASGGIVSISMDSLNLDSFFLGDPGAVVDVSGTSGIADFRNVGGVLPGDRAVYVPRVVQGNAGAISITGFNGGSLDGSYRLGAGAGAYRGALSVAVGSGVGRRFSTLRLADGSGVAASSSTPVSGLANLMLVNKGALADSGVGALTLEASDAIVFEGDTRLSAGRLVTLNTPVIGLTTASTPGSTVSIVAPYVAFGPAAGFGEGEFMPVANPVAAANTAGVLGVTADVIDFERTLDLGSAAVGGFGTARFAARTDIRLSADVLAEARLYSAGDIVLESAQTYVTSGASSPRNYTVRSDRSVTILGNGGEATAPYSFGGSLAVRAPVVTQAGVLRAPLGTITLIASDRLTLEPGSITSVSLNGLTVPYGAVSGGFFSGDATQLSVAGALPTAAVRLDGATVDVKSGATVDVSGGGDLYAYEFVAGNGGSSDILNAPGTFAILPGYRLPAAPVVTANGGINSNTGTTYASTDGLNDATLKAGDTIRIESMPGLADGYYTLLPAHYALLKGGVAIRKLDSGYASAGAAETLPDGSVVIGAYRAVAGTPVADNAYGRWLAMDGDVIRARSQFNEYGYNASVTKLATDADLVVPRITADAGTLTLSASVSLTLNGSGNFAAGTGGRLGDMDIAASKILVAGEGRSAPDAGYLVLDPGELTRFGVGSLLIGGTRVRTTEGVVVTTVASDIRVANDAAGALVAPEAMFVARDSLTFTDGSVVRALGSVPADASPLLLDGDGAMVRLSAGGRRAVIRTGATATTGDLSIGSGVILDAAVSLTLDATRGVSTGNGVVLAGSELDLAGSRVTLGDAAPGTSGLVLSAEALEALGASRSLLIRSYGELAVAGNVSLGVTPGRPRIGELVLDAARIIGTGATGENAVLAADTITIRNSGAAASSSAAAGAGALEFRSGTLALDTGTTVFDGFSSISARSDVVLAKGAGSLLVSAPLTLSAGLYSAAAGSDYSVTTTGALRLDGAAATATTADFGGRLSLSGGSVAIGGRLATRAGVFEAHATSGDLVLASGAFIDATGTVADYADVSRSLGGGDVTLAASGDMIAESGSVIDVTGRGDAAGGRITMRAGGRLAVDGALRGGAGASLSADSGTGDAGSLLLASEAFTGDKSVRFRSSRIDVGPGTTIVARSLALASDNGDVRLAASVNATGDVSVSGVNVTLDGGFVVAQGDVGFSAGTGTLRVDAPVTAGGTLVLEAARDGADLRLAAPGAALAASGIVVRGRADYDRSLTGTLNAADLGGMLTEAGAWMSASAGVAARLGVSGVEIQPAIRVISTGDLAVTGDLDLSGARYGVTASPGAFVIRAAGNLSVAGSVSDGFSGVAAADTLLSGRSWDMAFASGGDITLAAGKRIRTGTGNIRVDAGRDLVLADTTSVIYTAGRKIADETGYVRGTRAGEYAVDGGDVVVRAERDILAPVTRDFVTGWLFRYGAASSAAGNSASLLTVATQTGWSVVYKNFEQGLGTLGGGDMSVVAGRDIRNLAVALPTTGQGVSPAGTAASNVLTVVRGGGDLRMRAGRDILGGVTMLGRGEADITAGGALKAGDASLQRTRLFVPSNDVANYVSRDLHALFALMDASLVIRARAGADIEAIVDPMMVPEIAENLGALGRNTFFVSYTDRTSADVLTASGDLTYRNNPWAGADLARDNGARRINALMSVPENSTPGQVFVSRDLLYVPGTVSFAAAQGDVDLTQYYTQGSENTAFRPAPQADGNLELLAGGAVRSATPIVMTDMAAEYIRTAASPFQNTALGNLVVSQADIPGAATNYGRGTTPSHADDTAPVRIYAMEGSILGAGSNLGAQFRVVAPKAVKLVAGKDIANVSLSAQNNRDSDVTVVSAGRDIANLAVQVLGEGALYVEAGRNLSQKTIGNAWITTGGNVGDRIATFGASVTGTEPVENLALPNRGADITVTVGASGADAVRFADAYLDPANAAGVAKTYLPELRVFLASRGLAAPADDAALRAAFDGLPAELRKIFLFDVYSAELRASGIEATNPDSPRYRSYRRGFDAISRLFPSGSAGNINLFGKAVTTDAGGDIRILAPNGSVVIDEITNPRVGTGVVTRNGGAVSVMSHDDIALGNSRVFTLQGGDLLMWTSVGDITAGAGSKTNAVAPKISYVIDNDGNALLNSTGLQTGSGIGVLDAGTGPVKSRLDLIAPVGTVDAGDAGIRSAGDLNIAALTVIGASNISASGTSTGVPAVTAPNVGAIAAANSASAASSNAAGTVDESRRKAATGQQDAASDFTVEVLGYGGGSDDERRKDGSVAAL